MNLLCDLRSVKVAKFSFLVSFLIIPLMSLCFYFLPQFVGVAGGYVCSFVIYWTYCLVHGFSLKNSRMADFYSRPQMPPGSVMLTFFSFLPVLGAFFAAFCPSYHLLNWGVLLIAASVAMINGLVEEFYWRGAFRSRYPDNKFAAFVLPWILFSGWHIAVYLAYGVHYQGGFAALVGGAFMMGLIWGLTAYNQKSIVVTTLAHILTNFFAFSGLIADNWLVK